MQLITAEPNHAHPRIWPGSSIGPAAVTFPSSGIPAGEGIMIIEQVWTIQAPATAGACFSPFVEIIHARTSDTFEAQTLFFSSRRLWYTPDSALQGNGHQMAVHQSNEGRSPSHSCGLQVPMLALFVSPRFPCLKISKIRWYHDSRP